LNQMITLGEPVTMQSTKPIDLTHFRPLRVDF